MSCPQSLTTGRWTRSYSPDRLRSLFFFFAQLFLFLPEKSSTDSIRFSAIKNLKIFEKNLCACVRVCAFFSHTLTLSFFFLYNFILSFFSIHYIGGSPTPPPTSPPTAEIIVFPTEYQAVAMPDVSPSTSPLTSPPTAPRLATNFSTMIQHTEPQPITLSSRNKYTTSVRQGGYTIGRKKCKWG